LIGCKVRSNRHARTIRVLQEVLRQPGKVPGFRMAVLGGAFNGCRSACFAYQWYDVAGNAQTVQVVAPLYERIGYLFGLDNVINTR
jgi:hypothetical protein